MLFFVPGTDFPPDRAGTRRTRPRPNSVSALLIRCSCRPRESWRRPPSTLHATVARTVFHAVLPLNACIPSYATHCEALHLELELSLPGGLQPINCLLAV